MSEKVDTTKETDGKIALKESYRWLLKSGAISREQYKKMIEMLGEKKEVSSSDEKKQ